MKNRGIGLLALGMIALPLNVKANVGTMTIESPNLKVGETKEVNVLVSSDVAAADGFVKSSDNSCLEIFDVKSDFGSGNYFMSIDLNGRALTKATTITVKGLKECNAKIIVDDASIALTNGIDEDRNLSFESDNIFIEVEKEETPIIEEKIIVEEKNVDKNNGLVIKEKTTTKKVEDNKKSIVKKETKKDNKTEEKVVKKTTKKQKNKAKKIMNLFKKKIIKRLFK